MAGRPKKERPGTYTPEGGTSPVGPAGIREWPAVLVFATLAVSLLCGSIFGFRTGSIMIGTTLVLAALLRLALPEVGVLAVRSRFTDIAVLLVLAAAVILLGLSIAPPVVDLPWVPKRTG
jgi:hypothetical protein